MKRILNYPGGKWRIAQWVIDNMPAHEVYLEPFFGSGAVYFNKPMSKVETINDLDYRLINMFKAMRDHPHELDRKVDKTPHSRREYDLSFEISSDPVEDARRMLVRCWFAIGGKTINKSGWRCSIATSGPSVIKEWSTVPEAIKEVAQRLKKTQIECRDAIELIQLYNRPEVLIYADPPYIGAERKSLHYKHEMDKGNHSDLLKVLNDHSGPVLLSGYKSDIYTKSKHLNGWKIIEKSANTLSGSKSVECLWLNPVAAQQISQLDIFDFVEG